ncbi:MAG: YlxR family protein [Clostridia bacterium]|nr:YlxR family protein [Clostridia bacterium]
MKKHVPLRMCAGCREMKPKSALVRVVKDFKTGEIKIDEQGKLFGRGAYICPNQTCVKTAMKKKALERSFKTSSAHIYESILKRFEGDG